MSIRNLDRVFNPRTVALIGASSRPGTVGKVLLDNLVAAAPEREIMLVNPKYPSIDGRVCHADVDALPEVPDLAVVAVPARSVEGVAASLAARGAAGIVVISAGFAELGAEGRARQNELLAASGVGALRVVGPNCLGVLVPHAGLNASFAHLDALPGRIAFLTQSGAVITAVLDWAHPRGIGFSHLVSLGNMADVDFGDMLDYLADDVRTDAILLYVESIRDPRKFMSASRAAARMKPVIAVKAARYEASARAASSHTGALAGSDAVYDAAFRRAGILRVDTLEELFDAVATLGIGRAPRQAPTEGAVDRLAILTNGGGPGVLAADALASRGGTLADLSPTTMAALDAVLPDTWSHANPVDIVGDAPGERYARALTALASDPGVDGILVINSPTALVSRTEAANAVVAAAASREDVTFLTSFVGDETALEPRRILTRGGVPTYESPEDAVGAFMHLVAYVEGQRVLMETPPSVPETTPPDVERARRTIERALGEGREWLTWPETKEILGAYGMLTAPGKTAPDADAAARAAAGLGGPVVLKVLSPDITHKSDVEGVVLGLEGPTHVRAAAEDLLRSVRAARPDARIDGLIVESMVRRPGATELIVGAFEDATFGPVLVFAHGGTAAEIIHDRAVGLPPLNLRLASEMMRRTKVHDLLRGYRNVPPANLDAVAAALLQVGQLVTDLPEIREVDVNPLLADPYGVIALDGRVRVAPYTGDRHARLSIRPYPVDLEEELALPGARTLLFRPIRPEDEPMLKRAFERLTPEETRFRFMVPQKSFSHLAMARFTQIDYDRDMVMVLTERVPDGGTEIHAVAQINVRPRDSTAEFAILVEERVTGLGLGPFMLERIIDYARARGIAEIHGDVLADNATMLKLCHVLGFTASRSDRDPTVVRVSRRLVETGR
ncbi:MAG: GNAT family N-acetyltransferase [Gemmatimonadales bacterium]